VGGTIVRYWDLYRNFRYCIYHCGNWCQHPSLQKVPSQLRFYFWNRLARQNNPSLVVQARPYLLFYLGVLLRVVDRQSETWDRFLRRLCNLHITLPVAFHHVLCKPFQVVLQEYAQVDLVYAWTHRDLPIWLSSLPPLLPCRRVDEHHNTSATNHDYILLLRRTRA